MCEKELITQFQPPRKCYEALAGLFKCQRRSRKQFSTLWTPCEVGASLFYVRERVDNAVLITEGVL